MKRSDMVCKNCVNQQGNACHLWPKPQLITTALPGLLGFTIDRSPKTHWCAQGRWKEVVPGINPTSVTYLYWGMSEEDGYHGHGAVLGDDE